MLVVTVIVGRDEVVVILLLPGFSLGLGLGFTVAILIQGYGVHLKEELRPGFKAQTNSKAKKSIDLFD